MGYGERDRYKFGLAEGLREGAGSIVQDSIHLGPDAMQLVLNCHYPRRTETRLLSEPAIGRILDATFEVVKERVSQNSEAFEWFLREFGRHGARKVAAFFFEDENLSFTTGFTADQWTLSAIGIQLFVELMHLNLKMGFERGSGFHMGPTDNGKIGFGLHNVKGEAAKRPPRSRKR
jgi:hypothetical protein